VTDFLCGGSPFLGSQSRDLGYSRQQFRQALAEGELRRILRNVYVDARVPDSTDLRVAALHLVMPAYAVLFGTRGESTPWRATSTRPT
jgi:hypothetical protein